MVPAGCRPMTDPGEDHMDNRSSDEDSESEASSTPGNKEMDSSIDHSPGSSAGAGRVGASTPETRVPSPQPVPCNGSQNRKGKKTQVMEAMERCLDRIFQHETASGGDHQQYERERLEWEKEVERNRLDIERRCLDFEMRRLEADERRAKESREFIMQFFKCLRPVLPPFPPTTSFNFGPYPAGCIDHLEGQFGPPAPIATPLSQHSQHLYPSQHSHSPYPSQHSHSPYPSQHSPPHQ